MKNITKKIIAAVFFIVLVKNNSAQGTIDLYSVAPQMTTGSGLGGGLNILSGPLHTDTTGMKRFNVQMGIGAFASALNKSNPYTISSGTGTSNVTISNNMYAVNFITRFSMPLTKTFVPYADLFAGVRGFSGNIMTATNASSGGSTRQNITNSLQFNYGISAGITASVVKWMKVDAGFMISRSGSPGQMLDAGTPPHLESNQTVVNKINIPSSLFMFRLGLSFPITSKARKTPTPATNKCSDCCPKKVEREREREDDDDGDDD